MWKRNTKHKKCIVSRKKANNHKNKTVYAQFNVIKFFKHYRIKRIEQMELVIARERKQNNTLDFQIAALRANIDDRNFTKDYLITEKDINTRNER